jgi:hypothetical protein
MELFLRLQCFRLLQRKQKFEFFDSRKKAQDVRWEVVRKCVCGTRHAAHVCGALDKKGP